MLNRLLCTTCVLAAAASAVHAQQYTLTFEDLLPPDTTPYGENKVVPADYAPAELVGSGITVQFTTTGGTVEGAAPGVFWGDPISPTNDHTPFGVGAAVYSTATIVLTFNQPVYLTSAWIDIYAANGSSAATFASTRMVNIAGYTNASDTTPAITTSAASPAHLEPWRGGSDELVWREVISLGQTPVTKLTFFSPGYAQIDDLTISTTPATEILHGDYNRDGMVNDADYTIWADTYDIWTNPARIGLPQDVGGGPIVHGVDLRADGNLNGFVDDGDYTIWADTYGAGSPPTALSLAVVPEPASASLLALGGLAALRRRRAH